MKNNFDFLRLLFSLFVVIAHSYILSGSTIKENWVTQVTSGQIELSSLGVNGFFIISGYLIVKSLERSKTVLNYFWKRVLRLYPALFIVLLLTIILAPFVYENTIPYLQNKNVHLYLMRNLSLYNLKYDINGVFINNPYPNVINGSLWTLCYEFTCYVLLIPLFFVNDKNLKLFLVLLAFILFFVIGNNFIELVKSISLYGLDSVYFFKLGTFFLAGVLLALLRIEELNYGVFSILGVLLLTVLIIYLGFYKNVEHILLPLIVLLVGLYPLKPFNQIHVLGDFSYGIYIYSFPIQQTLMYYFKFDTYSLMFWSVLLSFIFGYLSWNIIEKRTLVFKNIFANYSSKLISH